MSGKGAPQATDTVDATGMEVVVVAGMWHEVITDGLIAGAERALDAAGASWRLVRVPGSFELPLASMAALEAGADAVVAPGFQVVEERADQRCVQIRKVQDGGCLAGVLGGVDQQQADGVPVGRDGVTAGAALLAEPVGEKRLQDRGPGYS